MSRSDFRIHRVDPSKARHDLLQLWQHGLALPPERADAKFRWTYLEPPTQSNGVFVLSSQVTPPTLSEAGGHQTLTTIVGTAGLLRRDLVVAQDQLRAGLVCDLAVNTEHGKTPLVSHVRLTALREYDLIYGYPAPTTCAHCFDSGYQQLGIAKRYVAILAHTQYVQRKLAVPFVPHLLGAALDAATHAKARLQVRQAKRHYRLQWLTDVDGRFDDLWASTSSEYPIIGKRNRAYLHWRFARHPQGTFQFAALLNREQFNRLEAYAVVELGSQRCRVHLRDIFGRRKALGPLLDLTLASLRARSLISVSFEFLGAPWVSEILRSRGFKLREANRVVVVSLADRLVGAAPWLRNPNHWHLTNADEDA